MLKKFERRLAMLDMVLCLAKTPSDLRSSILSRFGRGERRFTGGFCESCGLSESVN
jgi:hypothetical protein